MVDIAAIFRIHGPDYRAKSGGRMPPRHLRAMQDIERGRTAPLGGQVYHCETGPEDPSSDHSCHNRHGPMCPQDQAEEGLAHQQRLLRPLPHFRVTFTLPGALRALARRPHKTLYHLLSRSSSEALQALALDPRFIGGRIGRVEGLHPWTRDLRYHPHVHYIGAGGGLGAQGPGLPARQDFLVHVTPLSVLLRAKFRDRLHKTDLCPLGDERVWNQDWVVHGAPVGSGEEACRYLAPYLVRVALRHTRLLPLEHGPVTFQDTDAATVQTPSATVTAEECIRRFLQHGLPDHFIQVRSYGFLSPGNRHVLTRVSHLPGASTVDTTTTAQQPELKEPTSARDAPQGPKGASLLLPIAPLRPQRRLPP